MKKLIMIMAAMFCMTGAMAQESKETAPIEKKQIKKMPHKKMDPVAKMARELDLTPEQMSKVRELNAKYPELRRHAGPHGRPGMHKGDSVRQFKRHGDVKKFDGKKGGPNMRPDMKKHKELQAKYDSELKNILTKKQFKTYESNRKELHEKYAPKN